MNEDNPVDIGFFTIWSDEPLSAFPLPEFHPEEGLKQLYAESRNRHTLLWNKTTSGHETKVRK